MQLDIDIDPDDFWTFPQDRDATTDRALNHHPALQETR